MILFFQLLVCSPNAVRKTTNEYSEGFMHELIMEYIYRFATGLVRVIHYFPEHTVFAVLLSMPILLLIWSINLKAKWFILCFLIAILLVLGPIDHVLLVNPS